MTEKRFKCSACGYPMRVIAETEDMYQCYCADCKVDRCVPKYSLKQFKRDIERGKGISNDLIFDMVDRTISENEQLKCLIDDYQSRAETDKETINDLHKEFENIKKENEQLKEENKKFKILKKVFEKYCDEYRKQNSLEVVSVLNKIAIEVGLITEKEWI